MRECTPSETRTARTVTVETRMFEQLGKREMAAVTAAAGRYAKFLGLTLDLR
jgi:hypothetical protein